MYTIISALSHLDKQTATSLINSEIWHLKASKAFLSLLKKQCPGSYHVQLIHKKRIARQASHLKVWTWHILKKVNFLVSFSNYCDSLSDFNMNHFLIKMGTRASPNIACGSAHGWRLVPYWGTYWKPTQLPGALNKFCQLLQNPSPLPLFPCLRFSKIVMPSEHIFFFQLKFLHLFWNSSPKIFNVSTYTWTASGNYKTSGWMVNLGFPE